MDVLTIFALVYLIGALVIFIGIIVLGLLSESFREKYLTDASIMSLLMASLFWLFILFFFILAFLDEFKPFKYKIKDDN